MSPVDDAPFDVITMGRVSADIYPLEVGVRLEDVNRFAKFLGGSPTNVAVAASRHGHRTAVITRTGDDPFGRFVHNEMRSLGVDDRFVSSVANLLTPVAFCELFPPDCFPLFFYREPTAPDLEIRVEELDLDAIAQCRIFWVTASGLSREPSRSAHAVALRHRARVGHTIVDLDYRPAFWGDADTFRREVAAVLPFATVVVGNVEEWTLATGESDPTLGARQVRDCGVALAIVKRGPAGAIAFSASDPVSVDGHSVKVLNGLGSGDGFGGALCHGLLEGWPLDQTLRFANVAGALVAARLECSTAMPTTAEVIEALAEGTRFTRIRNNG